MKNTIVMTKMKRRKDHLSKVANAVLDVVVLTVKPVLRRNTELSVAKQVT